MKIIGRADGDALVVQMDTRELARICGYHYDGGDFTKYLKSVGAIKYGSGDTPALQTEIPVNDMWEWMQRVRAKEEELKKLSATLHALADLIANHSPAVIVPQAKEPTS